MCACVCARACSDALPAFLRAGPRNTIFGDRLLWVLPFADNDTHARFAPCPLTLPAGYTSVALFVLLENPESAELERASATLASLVCYLRAMHMRCDA